MKNSKPSSLTVSSSAIGQELSAQAIDLAEETSFTTDAALSRPKLRENHAVIPPDPLVCRLAYSVAETATILGISEKSVRRLVDRGLLPANRALRHLLIPKKGLLAFLERNTAQ